MTHGRVWVGGSENEGNFKVLSRTSCSGEVSTGPVNHETEHGSTATDARAKGDGPRLPADRAFVVQFERAHAAPAVEPTGRVEHLLTGVAAEFATWSELHRFVERVLGRTDVHRSARDV
jgi:hypothetical protein